MFFSALSSEVGYQPRFTEATHGQAVLVDRLDNNGAPTRCWSVGGSAVFGSAENSEYSLFASDGTANDLVTLMEAPGILWSAETLHDERRWLYGNDVVSTDGTPGGTELVEDELEVTDAAWLDDQLVLSTLSGLWVSDGSIGGAVQVLAEEEAPRSDVSFRRVGDRLVFRGTGPESLNDFEPWVTDGTVEGTYRLRDIRSGDRGSMEPGEGGPVERITWLAVSLGDRAVFVADDGLRGEELWVTDGTPEGTELLADLVPGTYPSSPRHLTRHGDRVYFVAEGVGIGRELWSTNGKPGGTRIEIDLVPGPDSSSPDALTSTPSGLYFSAWTPQSGREAWRLAASADTKTIELFVDLAPGPLSSSPVAYRQVGGSVFLVANDNTRGYELWRSRDPDLIHVDEFESGALALWSELVEE